MSEGTGVNRDNAREIELKRIGTAQLIVRYNAGCPVPPAIEQQQSHSRSTKHANSNEKLS
jgi:hypothetical protein